MNPPRCLAAIAAVASVSSCATAAAPFLIGGDVSLLPFLESNGATYRDNGVITPAERIMVDHGANVFRLRLFVNPNTNYSATGGAIQNLDYTISLAQRIKASGAKVLLDFHYSDTWADPGKQNKPAAWASLGTSALATKAREYTRDSLQAFRAAGASPDLVQIGNETTNGMLWPNGQVLYTGSTASQNASWAAFGGLLNAGIAGVRDVDAQTGKHTQVALHVDGGDVSGRAQYYFNKLATVGGVNPTSYDIAGLSFYPTSTTAFANLQGNLGYAANTLGRQVMVLETNAPWKGAANGSGYPATPSGQRDLLIAVRDAVKALPNDRGLGVVWWYPEAIQTGGLTIWKGGAIALFDDTGGDALPAMDALQLPAPTWATNTDGTWGNAANWAVGLPSGAGQIARFGTAITAARTVTLEGPRTVGAMRFQNAAASYTIAGGSILTLDNGASSSRIDVLEGDHTIDVPLTIAGDAEINAAWTSTLQVSKPIAAGGRLTKFGSGTVVVSGARVAGTLETSFGTLRLSPKSSNTPTATLILAGLEIAPLATLDIANSTIAIDPASGVATDAMAESVRRALAAGRIMSSFGTDDLTIGYAIDPNTRLAFDGLPIDAGSLVLRLALKGDANIDGDVDFEDLVSLAQSYNATGVTWTHGDSDYDGDVDFNDLASLAQHYGGNTNIGMIADASNSFANDWLLAQSLVPEPTVWLLVAQAFLPVMIRRKNGPPADTGGNACAPNQRLQHNR